jgi:preprotein translocase subunit YajC
MTTFPILELRPTATILLQDPPDGGLVTKSTQGADGTPVGTGAGGGAKGGVDFLTLMILGVLLALIVSTLLGGRREKKKYEQMMSSIKKNDQVRTVGGIIGSVVEVKPDVVVLKIDENSNTKITVVRTKIEAVMKESGATE